MPMLSFSQTTSTPYIQNDSLVVISLQQLKKTNLIFLEHKKLKTVNELLNIQNVNLFKLTQEYEKIDSVQKYNLLALNRNIQIKDNQITDLNNNLQIQKHKNKVKNYIIGGTAAAVVITLLIGVLK